MTIQDRHIFTTMSISSRAIQHVHVGSSDVADTFSPVHLHCLHGLSPTIQASLYFFSSQICSAIWVKPNILAFLFSGPWPFYKWINFHFWPFFGWSHLSGWYVNGPTCQVFVLTVLFFHVLIGIQHLIIELKGDRIYEIVLITTTLSLLQYFRHTYNIPAKLSKIDRIHEPIDTN